MSRRSPVRGHLMVLEGPDGVGKSALGAAVAHELRRRGEVVRELAFPGHAPGSLGRAIYALHHSLPPCAVSALAMQALHVAAHLDAIEKVICPSLARGETVVLDRYWWSTLVYGLEAGCHERPLRQLLAAEHMVWAGIRPLLSVLVRRAGLDAQLQSVVKRYDVLAAKEAQISPVMVLDNDSSVLAGASRILEAWKECLQASPDRGSDPAPRVVSVEAPVRGSRTASGTSSLLPLRPTAAYDTLWRFASERLSVFYRRVEGASPPWTSDPVLLIYKFTNVYRAADRVSQYLIQRIIYGPDHPSDPEEIFFRIMLFKLFNRIDTWEALERSLGLISVRTFSEATYARILASFMEQDRPIYSAAYIIPPVAARSTSERKHVGHLRLLRGMLDDGLPDRICRAPDLQTVFSLLRDYPGIGDFLAYQFAIDLNYSGLVNFGESDFVVPGPGALDGLSKCFSHMGGLPPAEVIRFLRDRQEAEFCRLGLPFDGLWGRPLQLIDVQNLLCEVGKYARVRHPDLVGISGRSRIKQKFRAQRELPVPWFPPKWGLNELVSRWLVAQGSLRNNYAVAADKTKA